MICGIHCKWGRFRVILRFSRIQGVRGQVENRPVIGRRELINAGHGADPGDQRGRRQEKLPRQGEILAMMTHRDLLDDVLDLIGPSTFLDHDTHVAFAFYSCVHYRVLDSDQVPPGCSALAEKWERASEIVTDATLALFIDLAEAMELYWQAKSNEVEDTARLEEARRHLVAAACMIAAAVVTSQE